MNQASVSDDSNAAMPVWRGFALAATIATLAHAPMAQAADTVYFAGFGGIIEEVFRKEILPPFENERGIKVEYIPAVSSALLSRLRAQQNNQELDLVQLDSGPQKTALDLDLCAPITDPAILSTVSKEYLWPDNKAITWSIVTAGITYNKRYFEQQGWPAPTSWNDLRDPKFAKKVMMPTFATEFGVYAISMLARANGGNEANPEPGFKIMRDEVRPNVVSFDGAPGKSAELYQTEQAVIGVWSMPRVTALQAQGFPMEFLYPKEGAVASPEHACVVKKPAVKPATTQLLAYLMSEKVQLILAKSLGMSPTASKVTLPPDVAKRVLTASAAKAKLVELDYASINANREAWFRRWQREIER